MVNEVPGGFKRCSKCAEIKPVNDFGKKSALRSGRKNECRMCLKDRNSIYYTKHKDTQEDNRKARTAYKNKNTSHTFANSEYIEPSVLSKDDETKFNALQRENEKKWKELAEKHGIKLKRE